MNPNTGELKMLTPENTQEAMETGFELLPEDLQEAAKQKLAGADSAVVSLTSGGKLSKWASGRRKAMKKTKRKMAKASKKINRGK